MNRRNFNQLLVIGAAVAAVCPTYASSRLAHVRPLIKPPLLKPGGLIGLIAPSGLLDDAAIETRVRSFEAMGFRVKTSKNIRAKMGGYAGTVNERVEDLHAMFVDREVNAIFAARGGSGASAMLPHIDYGLIRRHPKIFVGFSDITALHLAIYRHAGLVTFHGPTAGSTFSDYTLTQLEAVLMRPRNETTIYMYRNEINPVAGAAGNEIRIIHPGVAEGRLVGGNLAMVTALIGTPYAARLRDHLLFFEDVNEAPYRIDRMLHQLDQSEGLRHAKGVMIGSITKAENKDNEPSLTMTEVLDGHFAKLPIPTVAGFSFGHMSRQFTIPIGVRARLDTEEQTLTLLEPAVTG